MDLTDRRGRRRGEGPRAPSPAAAAAQLRARRRRRRTRAPAAGTTARPGGDREPLRRADPVGDAWTSPPSGMAERRRQGARLPARRGRAAGGHVPVLRVWERGCPRSRSRRARCGAARAPPHAPGRVPFYISCLGSGKRPVSDIRTFEYREAGAFNARDRRAAEVRLATGVTERDFQLRLVRFSSAPTAARSRARGTRRRRERWRERASPGGGERAAARLGRVGLGRESRRRLWRRAAAGAERRFSRRPGVNGVNDGGAVSSSLLRRKTRRNPDGGASSGASFVEDPRAAGPPAPAIGADDASDKTRAPSAPRSTRGCGTPSRRPRPPRAPGDGRPLWAPKCRC